MQLIDLRHLGRERVIGSWLVGEVLVDPGPESTLPTLLAALQALDAPPPRALALTHIHLDHAGAAGSLARRFPELEVWVHEAGAPHLIDPRKLLVSAGRLYGEQMQRLWGEVLPVPAERVRVLQGGERIGGFRVAYTPGHASHHVSYLHEHSGRVFGGDVTGVRIAEHAPVLAPTPPPDIDLERWRQSLRTLEAWAPSALVPTHFGVYEDVSEHLQQLRDALDRFEQRARTLDPGQFAAALRNDLAASATLDVAAAYEQAMPPEQTLMGLQRYLRR